MVITVLGRIAAGIIGFAAGIAVWFASMIVLTVLGFSFYAPTMSLYFGLAAALIGAPLLYLRMRRLRPQMIQYLVPFLLGVVAFLVYGCVALAWVSF